MPTQSSQTKTFYLSPQLTGDYDSDHEMILLRWKPAPRPCFNPALLQSLRDALNAIPTFQETSPVTSLVIASDMPNIFNLGGDLEHIGAAVLTQNRTALQTYAHLCIETVFAFWNIGNLSLTTFALIEGSCFGGGFEAALAADYLVAEHRARFAFPEIKFNLFPGMGAYSFLERRVGAGTTEQMLMSGKDYSAIEMHCAGIVDTLLADHDGLDGLETLIEQRRQNCNGRNAILKTRRLIRPITRNELASIVEVWVDAALKITPRDLRLIQRLAERQAQIYSTS